MSDKAKDELLKHFHPNGQWDVIDTDITRGELTRRTHDKRKIAFPWVC